VAFWPLYTVEYSRYHYGFMKVADDTLSWQAFDEDNQLLDQFTRKSRVPRLAWSESLPATNKLMLQLSGQLGLAYWVESSTNLAAWTRSATNRLPSTGAGRATNWVLINSPARFYRARIAE